MLSFFPRDVLGEIWDLIESVSEGFPTYFFVVKYSKIKETREGPERPTFILQSNLGHEYETKMFSLQPNHVA